MSRWDIDPAGVRSVVTRTAGVAEAFEGQAQTYAARLRSAAAASGSQLVGQALADFANHNQHAFAAAVGRTTRVLGAAVAATNAYLAGDLEMAERAQRNATASAPTPGGPPR
jgi:glycerol kinase